MGTLARWRIAINDRWRYHRLTRKAFVVVQVLQYWLQRGGPDRRLPFLARAFRLAFPGRLFRLTRRLVDPWLHAPASSIWRERRVGWQLNDWSQRLSDATLTKSLVLKAPGPHNEKGVLFVAFEYNWLRLLQHHDVSRLMSEYFVVCATSNSPPGPQYIWSAARLGPDPMFFCISHRSDVDFFVEFDEKINVRTVPIMACDWINPDFYQPRAHARREIDLLMVAGWGRVKRHWALFQALRRMRRNLRVVLIGQDLGGRSADDVFQEARLFGVANRIEIIRDATIEQVTDYQCNSRVSVMLSKWEGSCVAVTESLFADSPVAMLEQAHVGSLAYINAETGVLLKPDSMPRALDEMVDRSAAFNARAWAKAHISCYQSVQALNRILQDYARQHAQPWTADIVPFCWRPDPVYIESADAEALAPAYRELTERHGVTFAQAITRRELSTGGTRTPEPSVFRADSR